VVKLFHPLIDVLRHRLVVMRDTDTLSNALFASGTEQQLLDQCTNGSSGSRRFNDLRDLRGSRSDGRSGASSHRRDSCKNLVGRSNRDIVLHEQVDCSVACTPNELSDLQSREEALDALGDSHIDSGQSEVGVLRDMLAIIISLCEQVEQLTMRA
jgi:hypothetical protein